MPINRSLTQLLVELSRGLSGMNAGRGTEGVEILSDIPKHPSFGALGTNILGKLLIPLPQYRSLRRVSR
jgi:hypothetical protein